VDVREHIQDVIARFIDLLDSGDHEGCAALFADDLRYYALAHFYSDDTPEEEQLYDFIGRSREELVAWWDWGHVRYGPIPTTIDGLPVRSVFASSSISDSLLSAHMMCNYDIDVDEEAGVARARSYMFSYQATEDMPFQPTHIMRCRDLFERRGETWEWVERKHVPLVYENMTGHSGRTTGAERRGSWDPHATMGLHPPDSPG
jgi:hypothetical protein